MAKARTPADWTLIAACKRGSLPEALAALAGGADPAEELRGTIRATAMGWAMESKNAALVAELSRRGARPWDGAWQSGWRAPAEAALEWNDAALLDALGAGGKLLSPAKRDGRLFYLAVHHKALSCLRWLLPRADIEAFDGWLMTGLGHACRAGWVDGVKALLAAGANPNARQAPPHNVTPLMLATKRPHAIHLDGAPCIPLLLAAEADPLATDAAGATALHWAIKHKNVAAVAQLADSPARDMLDANGMSPAAQAEARGSDEAIHLALATQAATRSTPRLRI